MARIFRVLSQWLCSHEDAMSMGDGYVKRYCPKCLKVHKGGWDFRTQKDLVTR